MKAVAPRIERLYESEVERWRTAWQRFEDELWEPILDDELQAFSDFEDARADKALRKRLDLIIGAWDHEVGWTEPDAAHSAFLEAFYEAAPPDRNAPDFSRWPEDMPKAPPDDAGEAEMWKICRREKGNSEDERLAAGWVLFQLAALRYCRAKNFPRISV